MELVLNFFSVIHDHYLALCLVDISCVHVLWGTPPWLLLSLLVGSLEELWARRRFMGATRGIRVCSQYFLLYFLLMLFGFGYGCRIWVCIWHVYCSIFVSFSISLKDWSVISKFEYVSATDVGHEYFRENEKSKQHGFLLTYANFSLTSYLFLQWLSRMLEGLCYSRF